MENSFKEYNTLNDLNSSWKPDRNRRKSCQIEPFIAVILGVQRELHKTKVKKIESKFCLMCTLGNVPSLNDRNDNI